MLAVSQFCFLHSVSSEVNLAFHPALVAKGLPTPFFRDYSSFVNHLEEHFCVVRDCAARRQQRLPAILVLVSIQLLDKNLLSLGGNNLLSAYFSNTHLVLTQFLAVLIRRRFTSVKRYTKTPDRSSAAEFSLTRLNSVTGKFPPGQFPPEQFPPEISPPDSSPPDLLKKIDPDTSLPDVSLPRYHQQ